MTLPCGQDPLCVVGRCSSKVFVVHRLLLFASTGCGDRDRALTFPAEPSAEAWVPLLDRAALRRRAGALTTLRHPTSRAVMLDLIVADHVVFWFCAEYVGQVADGND